MIAVLSNGTTHQVRGPEEALALVGRGIILDALLPDDHPVTIPLSLVMRMAAERGVGTGLAKRAATIDEVLKHVPGTRTRK